MRQATVCCFTHILIHFIFFLVICCLVTNQPKTACLKQLQYIFCSQICALGRACRLGEACRYSTGAAGWESQSSEACSRPRLHSSHLCAATACLLFCACAQPAVLQCICSHVRFSARLELLPNVNLGLFIFVSPPFGMPPPQWVPHKSFLKKKQMNEF